MRKLALLMAGGALWLFVAALPAFADGGPHVAGTNNGTAGLNADTCAGCHRAHTATATNLLNDDQPALCLDCHDGSKSVVDVLDGVQYSGNGKTIPVLGALRGGGFQYALIDSSNAARLSYTSSHGVGNIGHVQPLASGQPVTSTHGGLGGINSATWGTGTVWGNGAVNSGVGATVVLECTSCHNPHGNGQYRILQTTSDFDTATQVKSGTWTKSTRSVEVQDTTTTGTHNYTIKPATDGLNANGSAANIVTADTGDYWRYHWDPTGTLSWTLTDTTAPPADPMNTGWSGSATSVTTAAAFAPYKSIATTLAAAALATDGSLTVASSAGFPTPGFIVVIDSEKLLVRGVTGTTWKVTRGILGTAAAAHAATASVSTLATYDYQQNATGLMTAWCIQCHTRYNGYSTAAGVLSTAASGTKASSLVANSADTTFMFKHGTTGVGCEQCHVSHGSNALMTGTNSLNYSVPGSIASGPKITNGTVTSGDSRLLKVDNRGTCQLCHDPTGTKQAGDYVGPTATPGN